MRIPPGKWSEDKMDYILDNPVPMEWVKKFCKKHHPDSPLCVQQALLLHTLPLIENEITIRPLPEGTTTDVVVSMEEITDPEVATGVEFPREEEEGELLSGRSSRRPRRRD